MKKGLGLLAILLLLLNTALSESATERTGFTEAVPETYLTASAHPGTVETIVYDTKDYAGDEEDIQKTAYVASLIKNTGFDPNALHNIQQDGIRMVEAYIQQLKTNGEYAALAAEVKKLNLSWQVFDAFGMAIDRDHEYSYFTSSDEDIDRKFRIAEKILGGFGLGAAYGVPHFNPDNPAEYMIHIILFATNQDCVSKLHLYAKNIFDELSDAYRLHFARLTGDRYRNEYDDIISNGNEVSEHSFHLPEHIRPLVDRDGDKYPSPPAPAAPR